MSIEKIKTLFPLLLCSLVLSAYHTTPVLSASVGGDVVVKPPVSNKVEEEEEEEEEEPEPLFADIDGHWAREQIEAVCGLGLFEGVDEERFEPDRYMTRAEFITVIVRYLYPTVDEGVPNGNYWYSIFYEVAEAEGILPSTWRDKYMEEPVSRQEIAYVMYQTIPKEELPETLVEIPTIPDYYMIQKNVIDDYRVAVLNIYSLGLMGGKNISGEFFPYDYGTRAECATVILNYVDPEFRPDVSFSKDPYALTDMNRLDLDFTKSRDVLTYSLTDPERPIAKVGDTVQVGNAELKVVAHPSGATYYGMYVPYLSGYALDNGIETNSAHGTVAHGFTGGGIHYNGASYYINPNSGEGFWEPQWEAILKRNPAPSKGGSEGESTANGYWTYSETQKKWIAAYLYTAP